jgi:hypothetical protein
MYEINPITVMAAIIFVETCLFIVSTYYALSFARRLISVADSIETSLDIMDERYEAISGILQIPLFNDSQQIRQVLNDIDVCRDAILQVANILGSVEEEGEG